MDHSDKSSLSQSTQIRTSPHSPTYPAKATPSPKVFAHECSQCGKFKVILNHTQYVLNGREAIEGQPHLWVEETPGGNLFSLHPTPHAKRWKVIQSYPIHLPFLTS